MSSRWRLDGYNAIVTGGSKGLGRACVEELLELGANVLITARGEAELQAVSDELIIKHPGRLSFIAADVSTEDGRAKLIERATELFDAGVVDILVNNVGTNDRKPASDVTAADYEKLVSTNQTSAFFLSTALLPMLRKSTNGASVVNVTSLAGIRSSGTGVVYAMTKAAMTHMSEALACEWAGYGIRVNAVAPWMARTPLLEAAVAKDPTALDAAKAATPLGRLGEPRDTAGAVAFLCMPSAAYITGQVLAVDGGLAAQGFRGPCVVPVRPREEAAAAEGGPSKKARR